MATGPLVGMMETQAGVAAATQNCGLGTTAVLALLAVASSLTVGLEHAELAPIEAAGDGRAIWSPIAAAMGDPHSQTSQEHQARARKAGTTIE
ncbi:MAG TPA: hypothetical protein VJ418_23785 [Streptosporangiaceae bacterium]|nr:hypothetical protein [Streptosporangiaceae bacterium]HJY67359.1 hypothetical protein [Streptosporangiaceae bacterium]